MSQAQAGFACAHCGAPAPAGSAFCCAGCAGAAQLIRGLGLDDYYRLRTAAAPAAPDEGQADPTAFVREGADGCTLDLAVDGLHCAACIWLIENALGRDQRVTRARLNATTRRLSLAWRGERALAGELAATVRRLGYRVGPFVAAAAARLADDEDRFLLRCLAVAGFAAANVMLLSVSVWAGAWSGAEGMGAATRDLLHWVSAAIALPALAYAIRPFARSAFGALRAGHGNMDVPIVVGVALTAAISVAEAYRSGPHAYFESALMLVFFLLVGRVLERRARGRARSAAANLLSLAAGDAAVEQPDGALKRIAAAELRPGDVLLVATGERFAADGDLLAAETQIDNAVVSGESLPVAATLGQRIHAGAVNLGPAVRLRVAAGGEDTLLARIARLLEAAEQGRGRHVALADRIARWYAPGVHLLAFAALGAWMTLGGLGFRDALLIAVAVLIVTCPCALALAQPAVAAVVVGRLARRGVLLVTPTGLERLGEIDTVVFDKTGTLTFGQPALVADAGSDPALVRIAAGMAAASRHPLARALAAAHPAPPAPDAVERAGQGMVWREWRLGSRRFCGIAQGPSDGLAEMWLVGPGTAPLRFAFQDELRPDAAATVRALVAAGYRVALLSGDRTEAVERMARATGVQQWWAEQGPEQKLALVRAMAAEGRRVLMVGDGVNDAPALVAAHASLSPGDATDAASAAADGVFQGQELAPVATTLRAARAALAATRRNLGLALVYNLVAVPVALAGLLTPPIAAAAMSSSSILIVLNALRVGRTVEERP